MNQLLLLVMSIGPAQMLAAQSQPADRPVHLQRHKLADLVLKPRRDEPGLFDGEKVECPMVIRWKDRWVMYYTAIRLEQGVVDSTIAMAVSDDLIHWRDRRQVLRRGELGVFDHGGCSGPFVWEEQGRLRMIYVGFPRLGYETKPGRHGLATSADGIHWEKAAFNPIHGPGLPGSWNDEIVYKVFILKPDDRYWMFYNAFGSKDRCEQIGLATSPDLRHWTEHLDNPLLRKGDPARDRDHRIIADPWIMRQGDTWEMYYFAFDGQHARECLATSPDLLHWTKSRHNPIMDVGPPGSYDSLHCHKPCIIRYQDTLYHFYTACAVQADGRELRAIALATSRQLPGVSYRP